MKTIMLFVSLALTNAVTLAAAPTWDQEVAALSRDYDATAFDMEPGDARGTIMKNLLVRAVDLQARFPDRGLPRAWVGWLKLDAATSMTDIAAMIPLFQESLANLEAAIALEPNCCEADPYITLAQLYQIPLSGKDQSETVRKYFAKAFAMDPNGLSINTRYAGYLMRAGDYENALKYANAALAAPTLTNFRPKQDKAVRQIARDFIEQTNDRMKRAKEATATK